MEAVQIYYKAVTKFAKVTGEYEIDQNNTDELLAPFPKPLWHEDLAKLIGPEKMCKDRGMIHSQRE